METEKKMAFGFFKKTETADLIFHNAHIFTQDPELPWADAVACRGEKIMGVGNLEGMESLIDKHTQVIDLDGKYLFPGFIDVHRSPVLKVFEGKFLDLSDCSSTEEVLEAVADWAEDNPDDEILFGYGYRDDLMPEDEADSSEAENPSGGEVPVSASAALLSQACEDRPVLLLCQNCIDCWTNLAADEIIAATAEEEVVETITVGYILNLLIPFDFEEVENDVKQEIEELSDSGFTTVLNLGTPDYFENLYQDSLIGLYNEGEIRQRFFGSYYMNRPLMPQPLVHQLMNRRTNCLEMNGLLNADTLFLYLDNENSPLPFSQQALNTIVEEVSDKNFGIFLEAIERSDMIMAYDALEWVRSKGYRNTFVIASDYALTQEELSERPASDTVYKTWGTNLLSDRSIYGEISSAQGVIDQLTTEAAKIIGMQDSLGSIQAGKLADFAIFDENPLECEVKLIPRLHASMTVLNGEIVYDADAENDMELYNLMMSQQL